jgi:maltose/moltooligosaccharide transporter
MQQTARPRLSFWQIWNMSFGFLGIQFGFALQGGNMSRIFQTLGAEKDELPLLWIAAPLTGLLIQPIIGYMSDRTWSPRWGRRRPYFLLGAVLSSCALFFAPYSSALWMAAGFLWVLDASINISMEPFRALVADKLGDDQRSFGFVVQTLIIGVGTWVASSLPWLVTQLGVSNTADAGQVPPSVHVSFAIGAAVFLGSILVTVLTTDEDPPTPEERLAQSGSFFGGGKGARAILGAIRTMPPTMRQLAWVQFFSWFAFFTMWSFATPALTEHVFAAPMPEAGVADYDTAFAAYNDASSQVSSAMGTYGLSSMAFALVLALWTASRAINRKVVHAISLLAGGAGFLGMFFLTPETSGWLPMCFALVGIAWGSILSMPYALVSAALPGEQMGMYMGIFNMFIVLPQIVAALGAIAWLYPLLGEGTIFTQVLAGLSLCLAAVATLAVRTPQT